MKKLLVFLLCASLAVLITACGHPSLKTQSAAAQPEQTQQPHNQTEQQSVDEELQKAGFSWSIAVNGFTVDSKELEASLESVYMRVGCTPSTGYRLTDLIEFAGEASDITGVTVTFEDASYMNLSPEDLQKDGTLLVTATDDEPFEKPLLGYEELIYMVPVVKITVNH